jgi:hypothetical protein
MRNVETEVKVKVVDSFQFRLYHIACTSSFSFRLPSSIREHHTMDTPNDIDYRETPASSGQETGMLASNELMVVSHLPLDIRDIEVNEG